MPSNNENSNMDYWIPKVNMPSNNENSNMDYWIPVGETVDFSGEITLSLSEESEAQMWAVAQGGIEIVER